MPASFRDLAGLGVSDPVDSFLAGWCVLLEDHIQERAAHDNRGLDVEWIQASTGGEKGEPWCADALYHVGRSRLGKRWPLPRTSSCDELLAAAKAAGALREAPARGHVYLVMKSDTDAEHTGVVLRVNRDGSWSDAAGNTNTDGSRDGYEVASKPRGHIPDTTRYAFIDWPAMLAPQVGA